MRLTQDANDIPVPLFITLDDEPVTGVVKADLDVTFVDALGQVQAMDLTGATLVEIGLAFPGRYLLTGYPIAADVDLLTETYITQHAGIVRLKWEENTGVFDAGQTELEIDGLAGQVRDLWLATYGLVLFDAENSRLIVHDESGNPYKTILLRDRDGGDVTIDGTGPVSHEAAVPYAP